MDTLAKCALEADDDCPRRHESIIDRVMLNVLQSDLCVHRLDFRLCRNVGHRLGHKSHDPWHKRGENKQVTMSIS